MHYREAKLVIAVRNVLLCSALCGLAACGGGGGGGNVRPAQPVTAPPPAPPPTSQPPVVYAPNPAYSQHLALTNTAAARQAGYTGSGVRIGVVDTGVMRTHPALAPRVIANLTYVGAPNNLNVDDVAGHGTAVSQLAAGTAFGAWPGGIAPGAEIVSARVLNDEDPDDDGSGEGNQVDGGIGLRAVHQDLINRGVRVMNNSWGGVYWTNPATTTAVADEYRPFVGSNGLVVFATGNEGKPNPSAIASLPSQPGPNGVLTAADLERGWLAVTAVNPNNVQQLDIGSNGAVYANACGIAMRYCLAAPGTVAATGTNDSPTSPTYWRWAGTSMATPQVSGAAALVWQAFPYFSNDLVRQTLLGTARDLGTPGVDATFGYGLLDVGRAVRGPARFDWGNVTANFASVTSNWSNDITGAGGLIKQGAGTLVLGGASQYGGATQVQGGMLRVANSVTSPVSIGSAGTLAIGAGGRTASGSTGGVTNQGTLLLDSGVANVNGTYQQSATARMALMVGAQLRVSGQATLAGNLHVLGVLSGYTTSARETFLDAGSVSGQFGSLTAQPSVLLNATIGYSPTQAWLDISRLEVTAAAQSMALSPASLSGAERVEGAFDAIDAGQLEDGPGTGEFVGGAGAIQNVATPAAAEQTLASLSGELHSADTEFALMAVEGSRRALESRIDALQDAPAAGGWFDQLTSQRAMSRFDMDATGWVVGQDRRHGERLTLGAALTESDGYAHHDQRFDRERNRQLEAQLYASYDLGRGYLMGSVAAGHMQRWTRRDVLLGAEGFRVSSDYAHRYLSANVQAGLPMVVGNGRITPYVGVQNLQLRRDGFDETGAAGFGLSATDSTMTLSQGLLGARFTTDWTAGSSLWTLQGRLEWQRLLSQSGADIDARFTGIDVWSPIVSDTFGRDIGVMGFGLSTYLRGGSRLGLDLDARHEQGDTWTRMMLTWATMF